MKHELFIFSPSPEHVSSAIDNYITFLKTTEGHNTDITNKLDKQKQNKKELIHAFMTW